MSSKWICALRSPDGALTGACGGDAANYDLGALVDALGPALNQKSYEGSRIFTSALSRRPRPTPFFPAVGEGRFMFDLQGSSAYACARPGSACSKNLGLSPERFSYGRSVRKREPDYAPRFSEDLSVGRLDKIRPRRQSLRPDHKLQGESALDQRAVLYTTLSALQETVRAVAGDSKRPSFAIVKQNQLRICRDRQASPRLTPRPI
jgi:hypothetical protein